MKENEKVLCFPATLLDEVGRFQGLSLRVNYLLDKILTCDRLEYRDRAAVENDSSWKQLIPYCVLTQDRKFFVYERGKKGGEARLHSKLSIGIGGHINPVDGEATDTNSYFVGFERELKEEVGLTKGYQNEIVGLINDDSDSVGSVHFGVVHQLTIPKNFVIDMVDEALQGGTFRDKLSLKYDLPNFEKWSQFVIKDLL